MLSSRRALPLVVLTLLGGLWASWQMGSDLASPAPRVAGTPPAGLGLEATEFQSSSGARLSGWLVVPDTARATVLLVHGIRSSRDNMVARARFLLSAGYGVLLFDLQAHGASGGERITFGHLESHDVRSGVVLLRTTRPDLPVAVVGVSLGGAAYLLGDPLPTVDALVLEGVFPTVTQAVKNRLRVRFGPPGAWLSPLLTLQMKPRIGISARALRPIDRVGELAVPTLFIAGEADVRTTLEESRELFEAAPEPKEFWVVAGAPHTDFHRFDPEGYEERVGGFLGRWLPELPPLDTPIPAHALSGDLRTN